MAEGDSILRIARRIDRPWPGSASRSRTPGPRRPEGLPADRIDGRVLERVESRGKHLLLHFEGGTVLHSHLGMRGSWHLYASRRALAAAGARRPGSRSPATTSEAVNFGGSKMRIATEAQLGRDPRLARLGPDLLAEDFDADRGSRALRAAGPADRARRGAARPEAGGGHRQHLQVGGLLRGPDRSDPPPRIARATSELAARPRGDSRPDARGGGDRPTSQARLPRGGRALSALRDDDPVARPGRRRAVSYWCPGCQTWLNAR